MRIQATIVSGDTDCSKDLYFEIVAIVSISSFCTAWFHHRSKVLYCNWFREVAAMFNAWSLQPELLCLHSPPTKINARAHKRTHAYTYARTCKHSSMRAHAKAYAGTYAIARLHATEHANSQCVLHIGVGLRYKASRSHRLVEPAEAVRTNNNMQRLDIPIYSIAPHIPPGQSLELGVPS